MSNVGEFPVKLNSWGSHPSLDRKEKFVARYANVLHKKSYSDGKEMYKKCAGRTKLFCYLTFFIIQSLPSTSSLLEFPNWLLWYGVKNYYDCETYTQRFNIMKGVFSCFGVCWQNVNNSFLTIPFFFETGRASGVLGKQGICLHFS